MRHIFRNNKVLGMYLSDNGDVYNNERHKGFIGNGSDIYAPILNLIQLNNNEEIRFIDGENKNKEIVTYNVHTSTNKNLSPTAIKAKRFNVSVNDLLAGPVKILLNFTKYNVTLSCRDGFSKTFVPIENDNCDAFKGRIILLTLRTLNSPKVIQDITGVTSYIDTLLSKESASDYKRKSEVKAVYEFVQRHWADIKAKNLSLANNTIKIVSMTEVFEIDLEDRQDSQIFLANQDIALTRENILDAKSHPDAVGDVLNDPRLRTQIHENSFVCFITDNQDKIGDRYVNVAGSVMKVPKVKKPGLVDGLYVVFFSENGERYRESFVPLEDMEQNPYICRSAEEANIGASKKTQYQDEIETSRLDAANEAVRLKREIDAERHRHEVEKDRQEKEILSLRADLERKKIHEGLRQAEQESRRIHLDSRMAHMKAFQDAKKYKRDSTLETLKVVGSVAGLLAGGFALYGRFSKR